MKFSIFIVVCVLLLSQCRTINVNDQQVEYYGKVDWDGIDRSPPASSRNPDCFLLDRDYTLTNEEFYRRVMTYVRRQTRYIKRVRFFTHDNDGLNWKRGDYSYAVIYY